MASGASFLSRPLLPGLDFDGPPTPQEASPGGPHALQDHRPRTPGSQSSPSTTRLQISLELPEVRSGPDERASIPLVDIYLSQTLDCASTLILAMACWPGEARVSDADTILSQWRK